jgi:uncharacterized protein
VSAHGLRQRPSWLVCCILRLIRSFGLELKGCPFPETVNHLLTHFITPSSTVDPALKNFLDAQNEYGNTGLHWAALGGYLALVKRLVEAGASPAIANDRNYLPLDLAAQKEHGEVVDFFLAKSGGLEEANADAGGVAAAAEGIKVDGDDDAPDGKDDELDAGTEATR